MKKATIASLVFLTLVLHVASADAHIFLASSTGKLTVKLLSHPTYTTASGTVECQAASLVEGEVKTTKSLTLTSTIQFEKCIAFGLNSTVTPAKVRSTAEGSVSLLKSVTVTLAGAGCTVTFPSTKNQNLNTIKYKNTNKQIEKLARISRVNSQGSGGLCGGEETNGRFEGDALVGLIGGTIDWQ